MKLSNCHTERTKNYCVSAFYSGETLLKQMSESRDESFVCFASHAHTKLFSSLYTSRPFCYFHLKFNRFIFFSVPFLIANKINIFIFAYTLKHVSVFFFFCGMANIVRVLYIQRIYGIRQANRIGTPPKLAKRYLFCDLISIQTQLHVTILYFHNSFAFCIPHMQYTKHNIGVRTKPMHFFFIFFFMYVTFYTWMPTYHWPMQLYIHWDPLWIIGPHIECPP